MEKEKKKLPLPILILIIGLIIGFIFIAFGFYKQQDSKRINEERYQAAYKQSQEKVDAAKKRLEEIENELSTLKERYEQKKQECDSMDMKASNWFADHSKCQREASEINSQITDLESEQWSLEKGNYSVYYTEVDPKTYEIPYIIGACVIGVFMLGAFIIYLVKGKKSYN